MGKARVSALLSFHPLLDFRNATIHTFQVFLDPSHMFLDTTDMFMDGACLTSMLFQLMNFFMQSFYMVKVLLLFLNPAMGLLQSLTQFAHAMMGLLQLLLQPLESLPSVRKIFHSMFQMLDQFPELIGRFPRVCMTRPFPYFLYCLVNGLDHGRWA